MDFYINDVGLTPQVIFDIFFLDSTQSVWKPSTILP